MKKFFLISLGVIALIYGIYKINYPTFSWKQKLTVVVDTPDGVKTGSSVVYQRYRFGQNILGVSGGSYTLQGEAVVVDLGSGKYLFALLDNKHVPKGAYDDVLGQHYSSSRVKLRNIKRLKDAFPIPSEAYPRLVTFDDINDPKTVREVDPFDLPTIFGEGYALQKMTLQMTEEPVTEEIIEDFPFWPMLKKQVSLSGLRAYDANFPNPINYLTDRVFIRKGVK